jgi:hypothetical protein
MKFYAGVTDTNWVNFLSKIGPENVNFWRPGGLQKQSHFRPNFK